MEEEEEEAKEDGVLAHDEGDHLGEETFTTEAKLKDWLDNHALLRTGRVKSTKSYQIHADLHENAVKKYGADNLVGIGHSRGAAYLSLLNRQQPLKHSIVYNKPTWTYDFGRKMMPNETNIRTSNDVVSLLRFLERGKNKRTIQLNTLQRFNPIYAHSTYGLSM